MVRYADHWTGQFGVRAIKQCRWYLDVRRPVPNMMVAGRCDYAHFRMLKKPSIKKRTKWSERKKRARQRR